MGWVAGSPAARSSGVRVRCWRRAPHLMPAALYPDPSPRQAPHGASISIPFTHRTMLPGSWERSGHGEGPGIWGSGKRAFTGRSLGSPSPGKAPSPFPNTPGWGKKGLPHLGPLFRAPSRGVKEVHLFSGSEGREPLGMGQRDTAERWASPHPSTAGKGKPTAGP